MHKIAEPSVATVRPRVFQGLTIGSPLASVGSVNVSVYIVSVPEGRVLLETQVPDGISYRTAYQVSVPIPAVIAATSKMLTPDQPVHPSGVSISELVAFMGGAAGGDDLSY